MNTPHDIDVLSAFRDLLTLSTTSQKKTMLLSIRESLKHDYSDMKAKSDISFDDYVEVVRDFDPVSNFDDGIMAEIESLGLLKKSNKPQTQWLSLDDRDYCYTDNSKFKHSPKAISDFPAIFGLMNEVNKLDCTTKDADAALVLVYNTNSAGINWHDDGEQLIDGNSSISAVTFGSSRNIQFCDHTSYPRLPQHTVQCGNHDIMVMKPGCQERLVHRVCRDGVSNEPGRRIVISFRKLVPKNDDSVTSHDLFGVTSDGGTDDDTPVRHVSKVTIIAGDSHTVGLDHVKLGRKGKRNVVNLSERGAHIADVKKQLEKFYMSHEHAGGNVIVEKIFICVGTNDIRHCEEKGTRSMKVPLLYLAEQIKLMFPDAAVWFQSLLPLPWQNKFTYKNVEQFNQVIYEVCRQSQSYYLNVFQDFLVYNPYYGFSYRYEPLFVNYKNIHLNRTGLSILARRYINLIHNNFNPLGY